MFTIEAHLLKHVRIFIAEIIEYDILSEKPARFSKQISKIRIIVNIRYPLIKTTINSESGKRAPLVG